MVISSIWGLTSLSPQVASAAPASLDVGTVEARLGRMTVISGEADNYRFVSPGASPTQDHTDWVTSQEARASHGMVARTNPTEVSITTQSTIGASPVQPGTVTEGTPFLLAEFNHYNNALRVGSSKLASSLDVRFLGTSFSMDWELWETPNQADPCDVGPADPPVGCHDELAFDTDVAPQEVTVDGHKYRLVISGFVNSKECSPSLPAGAALEETFLTAENTTTHGCLYASLDRIRELTVTKVIELDDDVSVPNFNFTTTTSVEGSKWDEDFSLAAGKSVTKEILSSETITIKEQAPEDSRWSVKSIECVDQNGKAIPMESAGGVTKDSDDTVTITNIVDLKNTPDSIECTFTNAYQSPANLTLVKEVSGGKAQPSDFTLTATGPTTITGASGSEGVTKQQVAAGTYELSESAVSGYEQVGNWECEGAEVQGNKVTIADGAAVVCTVTNKYQSGDLKVVKAIEDPENGFVGNDETPFKGKVVCTPSAEQKGMTEANHDYENSLSTPAEMNDLEVGMVCRVESEEAPSDELLRDPSYDWEANKISEPVTITANKTVVLTVTSPIARSYGYFTVTKEVAAAEGVTPGYEGGDDRTFAIDYKCQLGDEKAVTGSVSVAADQTSEAQKVPAGSTCEFTESLEATEGDFSGSNYHWLEPKLPEAITVTSDNNSEEPLKVVVTNHYGTDEVPEPEPTSPAPEEPPAETPPAETPMLPETGGSTAALIGLGVGLLVLGAGAWLLISARRRSN